MCCERKAHLTKMHALQAKLKLKCGEIETIFESLKFPKIYNTHKLSVTRGQKKGSKHNKIITIPIRDLFCAPLIAFPYEKPDLNTI